MEVGSVWSEVNAGASSLVAWRTEGTSVLKYTQGHVGVL